VAARSAVREGHGRPRAAGVPPAGHPWPRRRPARCNDTAITPRRSLHRGEHVRAAPSSTPHARPRSATYVASLPSICRPSSTAPNTRPARSPGSSPPSSRLASGLARPPLRPTFEPARVTIQPFQWGFACYQFAMLGVLEAAIDSDADKKRLCAPNPVLRSERGLPRSLPRDAGDRSCVCGLPRGRELGEVHAAQPDERAPGAPRRPARGRGAWTCQALGAGGGRQPAEGRRLVAARRLPGTFGPGPFGFQFTNGATAASRWGGCWSRRRRRCCGRRPW
jgi:hypothetical protein